MKRERRKGFEPLGQVDVRDLGLPTRQARELLLEHAWARVAGDAVVRRARAVRILRGVLEVAIADAAWAREMLPLLPRLVGRLARAFPELEVKRFRVTAGDTTILPPAAAEPPDPEETGPAAAIPPSTGRRKASTPGVPTGHVAEVARRYLGRGRSDKRD